MQNIVKEKVLCSAEKSSVIWAKPNSRSSAEPNVWSVTTALPIDTNFKFPTSHCATYKFSPGPGKNLLFNFFLKNT
jgi:hypothetical protein